MKVHNITSSQYCANFTAIKTKKETKPQHNKQDIPNIPAHRLNSALKAAIVVPLLAGSFAACNRTEIETSEYINPPVFRDSMYIHRFPEITVNGATFSEQSVYINKNLNPDSKVNRSLNNLLNTLDVPKKTSGEFPVNMFWSQGQNVYHMMMDGSLTDDTKYVYHLTDVNTKKGTADNYLLNFTHNGNALQLDVNGYLENNSYNFVNKGDSVELYRNNESGSEICASFKKKLVDLSGGNNKFTVEQTVFGEDTTKISNENFVVWSVDNE